MVCFVMALQMKLFHVRTCVEMKKVLVIISSLAIFSIMNLNAFSQVDDPFKNALAPVNLDTYNDKILSMGYNWRDKGILSVYVKKENDSVFTNLTEDNDLGLNINSKVRFDNYGNIWAFGRQNIWKFENNQWDTVPTPPNLLPNRYFRDFCFDDDNNIIVIVWIGFEKSRQEINGTVYVTYDSVQNELLKISTQNLDFQVLKKFYHHPKFFYGAFKSIAKGLDGTVAILIDDDTNNVMIIKDNKSSYRTIESKESGILEGYLSSSLAIDKEMNLWITVRNDDFKSKTNGLYKFTNSGVVTSWDSADGLAGKLFMPIRYPRTINVNNVSINQKTGIVWCGTDFGFFSIDESKPKNQQLTFYPRDSINENYTLFRYGGFFDHPMKIIDIKFLGERMYFANPLALLEYKKPEPNVSVLEAQTTNIIVDVFPVPSTKGNILISVKNVQFVNGSMLGIVDMSGRTVQLIQIESTTGNIQIPVNTKDLSSGAYYAVLQCGKNTISKQFIVR